MKVATFNANSLRSRLHVVVPWLQTQAPDVLCLQETKVQDVDFPHEALRPTGYHCVFRGEKKYNGVAILTKSEPQDVAFGFDDEPLDAARLARARVGPCLIVNTYVPQGQDRQLPAFQYKLDWLGRLRTYIERHARPDEPVLWMGDLNTAREAKDVYDPDRLWGHVCYCQEVQEALKGVMDWGFVDVFRQHCDEPGHYTFWDYRMPKALERNLGWRLDYIMATPPLAKRCRTCWIDRPARALAKPSDHTFLVAEFDI
ncbi:MAG TPA: exodeoxyribonuclease III [Phycisphaerales bacterium]|nr:exodeoxyribonuclease III [Phycisphaerales bacterium]